MLPAMNKSFREVISGRVRYIDGNVLGIRIKRKQKSTIKFPPNHFNHATVRMRTGAAAGSTARITSSAGYNSNRDGRYEVTLNSPIADISLGDKLTIKWNLRVLPLNVFPAQFRRCGFSVEAPKTKRFPDALVTTFKGCNLNNCVLPAGSTAEDWVANGAVESSSQHESHVLQNDLEYWVVDNDTLAPIEPVRKQRFIDLGVSIDPVDIPETLQDESVLDTALDILKGI